MSRRGRTVAPILAAAGIALSTAACGGSRAGHVAQLASTTARTTASTSATTASGPSTGPVAFSRCMRSNGVVDFPDPGSSGAIPKESLQQLGVSGSRFRSAQRACVHLLPSARSGPTPAQLQQARAQALTYARCVRSHGVPAFPDPDSTGRIPDPATVGINQGSPKFEAANQACAQWRPPYMPSNAAYNIWARTHGG